MAARMKALAHSRLLRAIALTTAIACGKSEKTATDRSVTGDTGGSGNSIANSATATSGGGRRRRRWASDAVDH
jgi:hypothetical protein